MLTEKQSDLAETFREVLEHRCRTFSSLKAYRHLEVFNNVIKHLPDCLEWAIQTEPASPPESTSDLRQAFDRCAFLKSLAYDPQSHLNLLAMGITEKHMQKVARYGSLPLSLYDLTVDHKLPLVMGGTHKGNLTGIPDYLNLLRNRFYNTQKFARPDATEVLTFLPKAINGQIPLVPIIPGGFRPHSKDDAVIFARTNELFGAPVL